MAVDSYILPTRKNLPVLSEHELVIKFCRESLLPKTYRSVEV